MAASYDCCRCDYQGYNTVTVRGKEYCHDCIAKLIDRLLLIEKAIIEFERSLKDQGISDE